MPNPYSVFVTRTVDACAVARDGVASAATVYSEPFALNGADGFGAHLKWTGTASGNMQLWLSDVPFPNMANDADWVQDTNFGTAGNVALGGAPGQYKDSAGNVKARWGRFKLSGGGGTGVLTGWVTVPLLK